MQNLRSWILAAFAAGALALAPAPAHAQTPADTAAVLLDVATQLEAEGRRETANTLFDLIVARYPESAAAAEVRRRRTAAGEPQHRVDRGGRAELVVFGTLYGMWLGIALPVIADAREPGAYGLGLLLGGPLGYYVSKNYADKSLRGEGHAETLTWGGTWGTLQGWALSEIFDVGHREFRECPFPEDPDFCYEYTEGPYARKIFPIMIAGGLAGIVAGDVYGRGAGVTPGQASMIQFGSLWGGAYGVGLALMFGGEDVDGDAVLASGVALGNAGLIAGAALGRRLDWSKEQVRLISIAGVAGLVAGLGIDLLVQPDNVSAAVGIPLVGSAIGLGLGIQRVEKSAQAPDDGGRPGAPASAALLRLGGTDGARLGLPAPTLTTLEDAAHRRVPAVAVPLLRATF